MGKGVGTDAAKNTFVKIYGLEECERLVQKYTDAALEALREFQDSSFMSTLANNLIVRRV